MMVRTQIALPAEEHRRAKTRAAQLNISLAEYVRRLVARDISDNKPQGDITAIFDLGNSGQADISRFKDRYLGEAVEAEHRRKTGR